MLAGLDVPEICKVEGCKQPAQIYSKKTMNSNGKNTYLKTCSHHTYKDLNIPKIKASE